jgi:hypothetical protein
MRTTAQQNQLLKQYLQGSLQYRETYEEVYDHIISAVECVPAGASFENEVNRVICEDFGGYEELAEMENMAKKEAIVNGLKKYLSYFNSYLKWPVLLSTIAGSVCVYFALTQLRFVPVVLKDIFAMVCICPKLLSLFRYYQTGYILKDTRKSVKDNIFNKIAQVPLTLFILFMLWSNNGLNKGSDINPVVLTVLFVLAVNYTLSLFKLYKDEFKMSIISRG